LILIAEEKSAKGFLLVLAKSGVPRKAGPTSVSPQWARLKFAFEIQLEAAAGVGRAGETEVRAGDANERDIVRVI
jgi:hypothetical protein